MAYSYAVSILRQLAGALRPDDRAQHVGRFGFGDNHIIAGGVAVGGEHERACAAKHTAHQEMSSPIHGGYLAVCGGKLGVVHDGHATGDKSIHAIVGHDEGAGARVVLKKVGRHLHGLGRGFAVLRDERHVGMKKRDGAQKRGRGGFQALGNAFQVLYARAGSTFFPLGNRGSIDADFYSKLFLRETFLDTENLNVITNTHEVTTPFQLLSLSRQWVCG